MVCWGLFVCVSVFVLVFATLPEAAFHSGASADSAEEAARSYSSAKVNLFLYHCFIFALSAGMVKNPLGHIVGLRYSDAEQILIFSRLSWSG